MDFSLLFLEQIKKIINSWQGGNCFILLDFADQFLWNAQDLVLSRPQINLQISVGNSSKPVWIQASAMILLLQRKETWFLLCSELLKEQSLHIPNLSLQNITENT